MWALENTKQPASRNKTDFHFPGPVGPCQKCLMMDPAALCCEMPRWAPQPPWESSAAPGRMRGRILPPPVALEPASSGKAVGVAAGSILMPQPPGFNPPQKYVSKCTYPIPGVPWCCLSACLTWENILLKFGDFSERFEKLKPFLLNLKEQERFLFMLDLGLFMCINSGPWKSIVVLKMKHFPLKNIFMFKTEYLCQKSSRKRKFLRAFFCHLSWNHMQMLMKWS